MEKTVKFDFAENCLIAICHSKNNTKDSVPKKISWDFSKQVTLKADEIYAFLSYELGDSFSVDEEIHGEHKQYKDQVTLVVSTIKKICDQINDIDLNSLSGYEPIDLTTEEAK